MRGLTPGGARSPPREVDRTMLLDLSADQELYRDTTARFLREHAPVGELRRLRDEPAGYVPELWRRGAELGWTSLLVPDERGGSPSGSAAAASTWS